MPLHLKSIAALIFGMKNGYLRDFADGFLSSADRISVMRYEHGKLDPRKWEDYRKRTSPGIRAIQSYSLRDARSLGDKDFIPESRFVREARRELAYYMFGSDGFVTGQHIGNVAMISGIVPLGFYLFSMWERTRENRIRKHFEKLQQEISSV